MTVNLSFLRIDCSIIIYIPLAEIEFDLSDARIKYIILLVVKASQSDRNIESLATSKLFFIPKQVVFHSQHGVHIFS